MKKKRIIKAILAVGFCCIVIFLGVWFRIYRKNNAVKEEMLNRLKLLSSETNTVCLAEFTPFIWDSAYTYGGYRSLKEFKELMGEKEARYIAVGEFKHRIMFFYRNDIVFDTGVVHKWYMNPKGVEDRAVLNRSSWLDLIIADFEDRIILYFEKEYMISE